MIHDASRYIISKVLAACSTIVPRNHSETSQPLSVSEALVITSNHTAQNMKLLQELEHYKSLNIAKNCKEEIIRFISLLCLFQCLHVQQITTFSKFCLNHSLSLNLQGMVNNIKTIVFWKLVCIFCYIVAKKISSKGKGILTK